MAQVANAVHQDVEMLLSHLTDIWQRLPEIAAEIDDWEVIDQIDFIEEWPLEEQRFERLACYVAEGTVTSDQLARFEELKRLVAQNRPIIHRLQQS